jgi:hypothetical protein
MSIDIADLGFVMHMLGHSRVMQLSICGCCGVYGKIKTVEGKLVHMKVSKIIDSLIKLDNSNETVVLF